MKTIETIVALLAWLVLSLVLYALSPLLIKLIEMANHMNHFFGR